MGEGLVNHCRFLDADVHLDGAAAGTASLDFDIEHSLEALRPRHKRTVFGRCFRRSSAGDS